MFLAAQFAGNYSVSGYVYDTEGKPLVGATVQLEGGQTVLSDTNGYYVFTGLGAGTYTITVSKTGYAEQSGQVTVNKNTQSVNLAITVKKLNNPVLFAGARSCANNSQTVSANRIRVYSLDGQFVRDFDSGFTGKGIALSATDFGVAAALRAKGSEVRVFDAAGTGLGALLLNMDNKGIQAVFADFNNDGVEEILIASQAADTRMYRYRADGTPEQTLALLSKAAEFKLAAGDVMGHAEIVLALTRQSAGPNVFVYDATGRLMSGFTALPGKQAPGLTVAVADLDGDGRAEIIAGNAEKNAGFEIGVYSAQGTQLSRFYAYPADHGVPPDLAGCTDYAAQGLLLAAGQGHIFAAINGGRNVRVFNSSGSLLGAFPVTGADAALSGLSLGEAAE